MISKGAYIIQDKVRRSYSLITNLTTPNSFFVRGRLTFFQGMKAISIWFRNTPLANVLTHRFFLERQCYPAQASCQMHLTDEIQNVARVINGLRYMRDDGSKLDNTMMIVTDYQVRVSGRMLCLQPTLTNTQYSDENQCSQLQKVLSDKFVCLKRNEAASLSQEELLLFNNNQHRYQGKQQIHVHTDKSSKSESSAAVQMALPLRYSPSSSFSSSQLNRQRMHKRQRLNHLVSPPITFFPSAQHSCNPHRDANARYFHTLYCLYHNVPEQQTPLRFHFPQVRGGYTVLYNPIETNERTMIELFLRLHEQQRVVCAIVLPTRQSYREAQLWADAFPTATIYTSSAVPVIHSLPNDLAITSLQVHTQHKTLCDRQIKRQNDRKQEEEEEGVCVGANVTSSSQQTSSKHNMDSSISKNKDNHANEKNSLQWSLCANGAWGLEFPQDDIDEVKQMQKNTNKNNDDLKDSQISNKQSQATSSNTDLDNKECQQNRQLQRERIATWQYNRNNNSSNSNQHHHETMISSDETHDKNESMQQKVKKSPMHKVLFDLYGKVYHFNDEIGNDEADVVYLNAALFQNVNATEVGLRSTDAHRIRLLDECATHDGRTLSDALDDKNNNNQNSNSSSTPHHHLVIPQLHSVLFTPRIACYRVDGDAIANEYVLFDAHTNTLACTDLFHGDYGDLDLLNSWLCRIWFKFMRRGNFHDISRVPRFKWLQVLQQQETSAKVNKQTTAINQKNGNNSNNANKQQSNQNNDENKYNVEQSKESKVNAQKKRKVVNGLTSVRRSIDLLTRHLPIDILVYAHGTSPLTAHPANALRAQWGMTPLHQRELPQWQHQSTRAKHSCKS